MFVWVSSMATRICVASPWRRMFGKTSGCSSTSPFTYVRFLIKPLGDVALFAGFAGAGLWFRKTPATHTRLMLVATLTIISPAIVRWPVIGGNGLLAEAVILTLIVGCGINDFLRERRVHPAFVWGALLIALSIPLRIAIAFTDTWHDIAAWLTR